MYDGHVVEAAQSQRRIRAAQQCQGVGRQRGGVGVLGRVSVALQKIPGFGHRHLLFLKDRGHYNVSDGKHLIFKVVTAILDNFTQKRTLQKFTIHIFAIVRK